MAATQYWKRGAKPVRHRWDDALARMDPLEFEGLIAEHYRREGFRVEHVGTGGSRSRYDGGIDLKLYRDDEYVIVQCKRYTAVQVAHNDVHEFLGIMHTERATRAIFVNSGEYTSAALSKLQGIPNFQMIDGHELRRMIGPLPEAAVQPEDARWRPEYADTGPPGIATEPAHGLGTLVFRARGVATSKTRSPADPSNAIWWLVTLVGAVAIAFLIRALLARTAWSAGNGIPTAELVQPKAQPRPSGEIPAVTDTRSTGGQPELIDWYTGTTIQDRNPTAPVPRQPTSAEILESQRRADEAMKVLESNTIEF